MNKVVIVMTAKGGKTREAIAGVKALMEHAKSKHDLKGEAYMQLFGTAGTIYVIVDYKDVATAQAAQAKLMADNGYWALTQKLADLVVDPPTITLLQSV
jgi:hypothetical protein